MMITNMYKYNTLTKNIFLILCFGLFSINFAYAHNIERNKIEKIIEDFLIQNPQVLKSTLDNLELSLKKQKKQLAIELLKSVNNPVLFQKNADVTIYEFFDYNCGYCKSVAQLLIDTISEDTKVNLVFVEYPILSQDSYTAALVALASKKQNLYREFHLSLMNTKGRINENVIFKNAEEIGLNIDKLKLDMNDSEIQLILKKNREVAKSLDLNGTPAFIIGDIIYPGAINKIQLRKAIKLYRKS
jgi:protein-disulfide isomerase